MNHLESTFTGKNNLWRYLVMIAAVFIVSNTIGAVPLLIGLVIKSFSNPNVFSLLTSNPNDYSVTGLSENALLVYMLFPFFAGLAAIAFLMKPLHSRTFRSVINGTSQIRWNRFFTAFIVWLGLSALYLIFYLNISPQNFSINNKSYSIIVLAAISLCLIPFQAGFEEVLFRGYLMQGFSAIIRYRWFPLIMTSILFGLMHAINPEVKEYGFFTMMPQYILFGLIFGVVTILDDGIEAAIGAHAANNIFLCVMVTNKSSALQTAALYEQRTIFPWIELGALLITGIIFVLILKTIFRWKEMNVISGVVPKPVKSDPVD
jgi:membrane protease YdiL (CAAX protease family)